MTKPESAPLIKVQKMSRSAAVQIRCIYRWSDRLPSYKQVLEDGQRLGWSCGRILKKIGVCLDSYDCALVEYKGQLYWVPMDRKVLNELPQIFI